MHEEQADKTLPTAQPQFSLRSSMLTEKLGYFQVTKLVASSDPAQSTEALHKSFNLSSECTQDTRSHAPLPRQTLRLSLLREKE